MTQDVVNMHQLSQGCAPSISATMWRIVDASRAQVDDTNQQDHRRLLEAMGKTSGQQALLSGQIAGVSGGAHRGLPAVHGVDGSLPRQRAGADAHHRQRRWIASSANARGQPDALRAYEQFTKQTQENLARTTALFDEAFLPPSTSSTRRWIPCAI